MIKRRAELSKYLVMLSERYSAVMKALEGREATPNDDRHGLKKGNWKAEFLENAQIIDQVALKVAVNDLKTVLTQIGGIKQ